MTVRHLAAASLVLLVTACGQPAREPGPTGCADGLFGAARTVRSDDPGTIACVRFPGASGDKIRIRVVVSSGTWNPVTASRTGGAAAYICGQAAINLLVGRIEVLLERERQGVADLSHRLRTPVTSLRLRIDGLPAGAERDL
mgnify:CR=1 FL=1